MEQCGNLGGRRIFLGDVSGGVLGGRGNPGNRGKSVGTPGKSVGYPG